MLANLGEGLFSILGPGGAGSDLDGWEVIAVVAAVAFGFALLYTTQDREPRSARDRDESRTRRQQARDRGEAPPEDHDYWH